MVDLNSLPSSYSSARKIGSYFYFTGKPCKSGHISHRFARSGVCFECHLRWDRESYSRRYHSGKIRGAVLFRNAHRRRDDKSPKNRDPAIIDFFRHCPPDHHVDHILPVSGKFVCGLNTLNNLQYLPARENISKRNKVDPLTLEGAVCVLPEYRSYIAKTED